MTARNALRLKHDVTQVEMVDQRTGHVPDRRRGLQVGRDPVGQAAAQRIEGDAPERRPQLLDHVAPLGPVHGADEVASILAAAFTGVPVVFEVVDVNAGAGVVVRLGKRIVTVMSLEIADGRVTVLHAVGNPAKLARLNQNAGSCKFRSYPIRHGNARIFPRG